MGWKVFGLVFVLFGMSRAVEGGFIQYVGHEVDVESASDTPTTGWRNPNNAKTLDIDGDNILGTDGYSIFNLNSFSLIGNQALPDYISEVTRLSPNANAASSFGVMDNPADPSGSDTWNFGIWHTANSTPADIFQFSVVGNSLQNRKLRIGLLFDGYNGSGSQFLRVTQTVGGTATAQSPTLGFANTGLDIMYFDVTASAGDTFVVYADAVTGISHVAGITFDTVGVPEPSSFVCVGIAVLGSVGCLRKRGRKNRDPELG